MVKKGDDIAELIVAALKDSNFIVEDHDVFVIAHTIISRAEDYQYYIPGLVSSPIAEIISRKTGKDPNLVELIIQESQKILKVERNIIISKHKQGWICANAAVDQSNAPPNYAVVLPNDPNNIAKKIGQRISKQFNKNIGVLISDTHGRALRRGAINVAIGSYNFPVIDIAKGRKDLFGYELKSTIIALADEVCSAAELVMGQANEGIPVVVIRGLKWRSPISDVINLQYSDEQRLFQ